MGQTGSARAVLIKALPSEPLQSFSYLYSPQKANILHLRPEIRAVVMVDAFLLRVRVSPQEDGRGRLGQECIPGCVGQGLLSSVTFPSQWNRHRPILQRLFVLAAVSSLLHVSPEKLGAIFP